jgi:hypothetical protein
VKIRKALSIIINQEKDEAKCCWQTRFLTRLQFISSIPANVDFKGTLYLGTFYSQILIYKECIV